jgi:hypothetical protein
MKRMALACGAALTLLGGCASYGTSGNYYGGGGYYEPDYYGPGQAVAYGGHGREHRDGDHAWRDADHNQDRTHSDHQSNDQANRQNDYQRHTSRDNQPAPQNNALGGTHGSNTMSNGAPTRGNFWQLDQVQHNAAPQSGSSQPSTGSGHMSRHHDN